MKDATTAIGRRDPVKYAREAHYRAELERSRADRFEAVLRKMLDMGPIGVGYTAEHMRRMARNALAGVSELYVRRERDDDGA